MRIALLIIFTIISANLHALVIKYGTNEKKWQSVNWRNVKFYRGPGGTMNASLAENEYSGRENNTVLLLHFNNKKEIRKGLSVYNFSVDKSTALIDKRRFKYGNGAALFYKTGDTIRLKLSSPNFFENHVDTGPFTIEFWAFPFSRGNRQIIFQKYSPIYNGNRISHYSGVRVFFYNGKIVWEFVNIFKDPNSSNRYAIVRISSKVKIPLYKWRHHALTYNPVTGKLVYYLNGESVNTIFCTDTGQADDTVLAGSFNRYEHGMLVIGKNYQGLIDEFAILSKVKHTFNLNKYVSRMGIIESGIIDLSSTGTVVKEIKAKYKAIHGSGIILEYRIANSYFRRDKPETIFAWREYNLTEPLQNGVIRGRFFQWRIKLLGCENGKYSPIINHVVMKFSKDRVPFKPLGLIAVSFNKKVYLTWRGNTENDVVGYKIYYGRARGLFNGTLAMQGFSPIHVPISSIRNPLMPRFTLSGLRTNHLYYIAITAYDRSGQESAFSREVFVRVKRFKQRTHRGIFAENTGYESR